MTLSEIIIKAIPLDSCPQKKANALHRRELLEKRINAYIAEQLSQQFNAKHYNGTQFGMAESEGNVPEM